MYFILLRGFFLIPKAFVKPLCRGESPCIVFLRDFFLSCQKETPQTPKKRRFGAYRRLNPVFTKLFIVGKFPSLMVNELPHRRPCVCFASLAALMGNRWNPRREAALCLHTQCGVFLWGATPVSLGKTKEMGWQRVLQGPALVLPRGAKRRAIPPGVARCFQAQPGYASGRSPASMMTGRPPVPTMPKQTSTVSPVMRSAYCPSGRPDSTSAARPPAGKRPNTRRPGRV